MTDIAREAASRLYEDLKATGEIAWPELLVRSFREAIDKAEEAEQARWQQAIDEIVREHVGPSPRRPQRYGGDEVSSRELSAGDYVLATKYDDGNPCDHFVVGFITGSTWHGRWIVADEDGKQFRHNGFRRAEKITRDEGQRLLAMFDKIGDVPGPSLWDHLLSIRAVDEVKK